MEPSWYDYDNEKSEESKQDRKAKYAVILFLILGMISVLAAGIFGPALSYPTECTTYCERIHKWAVQCGQVPLEVDTCLEAMTSRYRTDKSGMATSCWEKFVQWSTSVLESDCSKAPPTL